MLATECFDPEEFPGRGWKVANPVLEKGMSVLVCADAKELIHGMK